MARIRTIHPSVWDDEDVGSFSDGAFRALIVLISNADDEGRVQASARYVRGIAWRYQENYLIATVQAHIEEVDKGMRSFVRYVVDGREYAVFLKYRDWQTPKKPQPSKLPPPPAAAIESKRELVKNRCGTSGLPVADDGGTVVLPVPPGLPIGVEKVTTSRSKVKHVEDIEGKGVGRDSEELFPLACTINASIRQCFEVLSDIKGYPYDAQKDGDHIGKLMAEFPNADPVKVCRDFATYVLDKPLKKKANPRLQLRRFFSNANDWHVRDNGSGTPVASAGADEPRYTDSEDMIAAIRGATDADE